MDPKALVILALKVSIICTVVGFGLKATVSDLLYLFRRPALLWRSMLAMNVLVPIMAIILVGVFNFRHTVEVALMALAISPLPPILPRKESKAGGHYAYGIALMATLALLAIVTVPLWEEILQRLFNRELGATSGAIAKIVLMSTVLPLLAGTLVRAVSPALADRIAEPIAMIGRVLLPLAVVVLLAGAWRALLATFGDGTAIAMVIFVVVALAIGHVLGGPDPDHSVVLALSSASRHPAIALAIASASFPDERFGATILLYLLVNGIVGVAYLKWRHRSLSALAAPGH